MLIIWVSKWFAYTQLNSNNVDAIKINRRNILLRVYRC